MPFDEKTYESNRQAIVAQRRAAAGKCNLRGNAAQIDTTRVDTLDVVLIRKKETDLVGPDHVCAQYTGPRWAHSSGAGLTSSDGVPDSAELTDLIRDATLGKGKSPQSGRKTRPPQCKQPWLQPEAQQRRQRQQQKQRHQQSQRRKQQARRHGVLRPPHPPAMCTRHPLLELYTPVWSTRETHTADLPGTRAHEFVASAPSLDLDLDWGSKSGLAKAILRSGQSAAVMRSTVPRGVARSAVAIGPDMGCYSPPRGDPDSVRVTSNSLPAMQSALAAARAARERALCATENRRTRRVLLGSPGGSSGGAAAARL
jgi:hypothetical protein